jgi:lysophospholipase L1-like esterase
MKLSLLPKIALSIGVLVALLGALEIGCRVFGLGKKQEIAGYIANWALQWQDDFYVLSPGEDANRDGLRDRNHTIENPLGRTRVAFLGDSVTYGYLLPRDASYPAILDRLINERTGGAEFSARTAAVTERNRTAGIDGTEVFNVALPGWSTHQQRLAYERIVRKYKPNHVLLGFCLNDVAEMQNNLSKPRTLLARAYTHSYAVRFAMNVREREVHRVEELFTKRDSPSVRRGWQLTLAEISKLAEAVRADGATFTLLILPFRFQVEPGAPEPTPQQTLARFARDQGIRAVDLLPALAPLGTDGFIDYDHLSLRGAQRVAEAILESRLMERRNSSPRKRRRRGLSPLIECWSNDARVVFQ